MQTTGEGRHPWKNWSGSIRFQASRVIAPDDYFSLQRLISSCLAQRRTIRPVGSSHSSTEIYVTDDTLVSLDSFSGLINAKGPYVIRVGAGTKIKDLADIMLKKNLSPTNLGDVALQTIGGAIGTGTHGTGLKFGNLSTMLVGGKIINGLGELVEFDEKDCDFLRAARVSLGMLGILVEMDLKLIKATRLRRSEYFTVTSECMKHLESLIHSYRHFDFYWYPRSDEIKLRTLDLEDEKRSIDWALKVEERVDWSQYILHKHTEMTNRFEEMEYELPLDKGPACFLEVRQRIRQKWTHLVAWRVLYRTIAGDDSYLSPATGRDTVSISLHQNAGLPYQEYFADIEPIFIKYGGRPHWAKKHSLQEPELRPLYPDWDKFMRLRDRFDPEKLFLTPYLKKLFFNRGKYEQRKKNLGHCRRIYSHPEFRPTA